MESQKAARARTFAANVREIVSALEAYRIDKAIGSDAKYPANLSDLAEDYFTQEPINPYTGKSMLSSNSEESGLQYQATGGKYKLCVVQRDVDDVNNNGIVDEVLPLITKNTCIGSTTDPVGAAANGNWYIKGVTYPMDITGTPILLDIGEEGTFGVNVGSPGNNFDGVVWIMASQNYGADTNDIFVRPTIQSSFHNSWLGSWSPTHGNKTGGGTYGIIVFDDSKEFVSVSNIKVPGIRFIESFTEYWDFDSRDLNLTVRHQVLANAPSEAVIEMAIVNATGWRQIYNYSASGPRSLTIKKSDLWACYKDAAEGRVYAKCDGTETGTVSVERGILVLRESISQWVSNHVEIVARNTYYLAFGYEKANPYGGIIVNLPSEGYVGVKISGAAYPSIDPGIDYKCNWSVPGWLHANGCSVEGVPTASGTFGWSVQLSATGYETLTASGWIDIY